MTFEVEKPLINRLTHQRGFVSGLELSKMLCVSTKTISRTVKEINGHAQDGAVIESRRGRGYRLIAGHLHSSDNLFNDAFRKNRLTSVERRSWVLKKMLLCAPQLCEVNQLWSQFYVSDSTISMDIKILRSMLNGFGLELVRKFDYVEINGSESNIRKAINSLLIPDGDVIATDVLESDKYKQSRDRAFVGRQLHLIETLLHTEIPYPYSVNIFSHLYILIARFRSTGSHRVIGGENYAPLMSRYPEIVRVSNQVINNFNAYLDTMLDESEVYNLYQYLISSRLNTDMLEDATFSQTVSDVTRYLIDCVNENSDYAGLHSAELFTNLAKHIRPLLNRLNNSISVSNNLLEQIRFEYPSLFDAVKEACASVSEQFHLNRINDEEIGFITVYFAQSLESNYQLNILLVCTTGLGTSQLLQSKIQRRFSGLHVVETVALRDLEAELQRHEDVELVVSTIELTSKIRVPSLVVSAMLTLSDQERLESAVERIRQGDGVK
ncbi:MAG: PRD domain-containing protein [Bifidobacterium sp.]|uniref:BglG family transcription antiterminator n=1 Tax=Bifidobacterium sp. TaxID=41200 RepID=UPI0039E99169